MAVDKLVDSTQLDSDLTSVANAIRTKGGTSAQLAFPAGFVTAIQNIPSGGGGLVYESGTYSPAEDTIQPTISFSNSHLVPPTFAMMCDSNTSTLPQGVANLLVVSAFVYWYEKAGVLATYVGINHRRITNNAGGVIGITNSIKEESIASYATASSYYPSGANTSATYKAGRSYPWVAVWW